jgi:hypothetical protein
LTGLQIEGVLAYFTHLGCQKCIGDDVGDVKYIFTQFFSGEHDPLDMFYPPYYARIMMIPNALKCILLP